MNKTERGQVRDLAIPAVIFAVLPFVIENVLSFTLLTITVFGLTLDLLFLLLGFLSYMVVLKYWNYIGVKVLRGSKGKLAADPEPLFLMVGTLLGIILYGVFVANLTLLVMQVILAGIGVLIPYYYGFRT